MRIAVVGCGIAGQAAAILLAEQGHAVTLFERFAEPRPLGAGLLLQPTGLAVLQALGVLERALALGAPVRGLQARTRGGRIVLDLAYADLHPSAHGLGMQRHHLFDLLHDRLRGMPVELVGGAEIVGVDGESLLEKAGRRLGPYAFIVAADGAHSMLRQRLMPRAYARLYPWGCLWANLPDSVGFAAAGLLRQRVHGTRQMMGLLPVGPDMLTMYWSVPVGELDKLDLAAWRQTALALWPDAAPLIEHAAASDIFARATYRNVALPSWHQDRVLFIGDAAHGTSPQLGQGANLALVDAWVLARVIKENQDLAAAVALFAGRRSATVRFYRQASHFLTPFFQSRLAPLGWLRDAFMGMSCRLPVARPMASTTLAGLRTGWFSAASLDQDGLYRL